VAACRLLVAGSFYPASRALLSPSSQPCGVSVGRAWGAAYDQPRFIPPAGLGSAGAASRFPLYGVDARDGSSGAPLICPFGAALSCQAS
jgi:hypothetical protein